MTGSECGLACGPFVLGLAIRRRGREGEMGLTGSESEMSVYLGSGRGAREPGGWSWLEIGSEFGEGLERCFELDLGRKYERLSSRSRSRGHS